MHSNELYIGNLDPNTKSEELREIFQVYGKIIRCEVRPCDIKHTASYGFVGFESSTNAEFAREQINGLNFHNRRMIVQFSKTKPGRLRRHDQFNGSESRKNRNSNERSRSRSRSRDRYRRPFYDRISMRDQNDRHRKRDRSRSSSNDKSYSKRTRLSSDDSKQRTSQSSQNRNSRNR